MTTEVFVRSFAGGNQKKVFGKRLVYLNKLLDDLGFWIEAQKYVPYKLEIFGEKYFWKFPKCCTLSKKLLCFCWQQATIVIRSILL